LRAHAPDGDDDVEGSVSAPTGGSRPVRARIGDIREAVADYTYASGGGRGYGHSRSGLWPVAGGERPFGLSEKIPAPVEAFWTRLRGNKMEMVPTRSREDVCGAIGRGAGTFRARVWPSFAAMCAFRPELAQPRHERRLFGATAAPGAAGDAPTGSAVIDMV